MLWEEEKWEEILVKLWLKVVFTEAIVEWNDGDTLEGLSKANNCCYCSGVNYLTLAANEESFPFSLNL